MRIVFMGTPDFAVPTLEALLAAGHEIVLAVTQPDKPRGRHGMPAASPVKECATAHGIAVYQPERIRDSECVEFLREQNADIFVVVAYGQILPEELLALPRCGCVNVHASLLPKYRGAAPIQWAVINGEEVTGVTTMRMDVGLDTGDIILSEEVVLDPEETGGTLFEKLSRVGAELCVKTLAAIEDGTATYTPQDPAQATQVGTIKKEMGRLDWTRPAAELERLVRGLDPWPGTFTTWNGRTLKVRRAAVREAGDAVPSTGTAQAVSGKSDIARPDGEVQAAPDKADAARLDGETQAPDTGNALPGTVVGVTRDSIAIQTGSGCLVLLEVQPEGKKPMPCEAFLRGYHVNVGDKFF